jgi:hypothetical protein
MVLLRMRDARHEDFRAPGPCKRRQDEQTRIGVLPRAEQVATEVARRHAAVRVHHADLSEALQARSDKACDSARAVGTRKTLKRRPAHGNRLLFAGTGGAYDL